MLINRETDYALRMIRALFIHNKLNVKQICEIENIPSQFTYKILKKLSKNNIVEITRGVNGGYSLSCDLKKTYLLDIIKAVEDKLWINECMDINYKCPNNCNSNRCRVNKELNRVQNILIKELSNNSLYNILNKKN